MIAVCSLVLPGPSTARADAPSGTPSVILRVCPDLDAATIIDVLDAQLPEVEFLGDGVGGATTPWMAEVCSNGNTVVATLQNTRTGASEVRTWPVTLDAGEQGLERLAAHVIAAQAEYVLELPPGPVDEVPDRVEQVDVPGIEPERDVGLGFVVAAGFECVGGLSGRTDEASLALGPGFRLGMLIDESGYVGFGLRALTVSSSGAGLDLLEALPLSIEGGWMATLGPVALGGFLAVIGERWQPNGAPWGSGWRAGIGAGGEFVVPLAWLLDVRVTFGVEFFPEGYRLGHDTGTSEEIVAELSNWRWRASAGFGLSIPAI